MLWAQSGIRKSGCAPAWLLFFVVAFGEVLVSASALQGKVAKSYPGTPEWPSSEQWQALNTSVSGRLIKFNNPGHVCYGSSFNKVGCESFRVQFNNASWMGEDPGLTNWPQWAGNSCPPPFGNITGAGPADGCGVGKYPSYVLQATNAEDVSAGLKWASKANVRVVVKNTGHDFLGRNVGFGSLSIWTRNIKGVRFDAKWNGTAPSDDVSGKWQGAAFTYGSGMVWGQINQEAAKRKHLVVSGAEGTVGAGGGWLLGGGHGPYSNIYGLGVEQVLEFQAVTPDGEIRIANSKQNQDLFWALRGGGASTYAIVTRVSYKTYPAPNITYMGLYIIPKDNSSESQDQFYNTMAYYLAMSPNFTDFGLSGYPTIYKDSYSGALQAPGKTEEEVLKWFAPIEAKLKSYGAVVEPNVMTTQAFQAADIEPTNGPAPEPAGLLFAMSSRLFSREHLKEENVPAIAKMLKVVLNDAGAYLLPYPNVPGISHYNRKWDFGLNPTWKTSSLHMISIWHLHVGDDIGKGYGIGQFKKRDGMSNADKVQMMQKKMKEEYVPAMDALSNNHGAYINEASAFEDNWKTTFYGGGEHYEKLLSIKKKYDPKNVLYCFPCVGGDVFKEGTDGKLYYT